MYGLYGPAGCHARQAPVPAVLSLRPFYYWISYKAGSEFWEQSIFFLHHAKKIMNLHQNIFLFENGLLVSWESLQQTHLFHLRFFGTGWGADVPRRAQRPESPSWSFLTPGSVRGCSAACSASLRITWATLKVGSKYVGVSGKIGLGKELFKVLSWVRVIE